MAYASMSVFLLAAALVNGVPSDPAFHPARAVCDLNEADLSGSGLETAGGRRVVAASQRDDDGDHDAHGWRAMAARCRNLAAWQNQEARATLLRLADEYEARARRLEDGATG